MGIVVLEKGEQVEMICGASFCLRSTVDGASMERETKTWKALVRVTSRVLLVTCCG